MRVVNTRGNVLDRPSPTSCGASRWTAMRRVEVDVDSDVQDSEADVRELEGTCIVDSAYEDIQRSDQVCLVCVCGRHRALAFKIHHGVLFLRGHAH